MADDDDDNDNEEGEFPLDRISMMAAEGAPLEEIDAALDVFLTLPDREDYRASVEHDRVVIYCERRRPLEECEALLERYLAVDNDLALRADTVDVVYAIRPEIAPRHLDAMIAQLEADTSGSPRVAGRLERLRGRRAKIA